MILLESTGVPLWIIAAWGSQLYIAVVNFPLIIEKENLVFVKAT